MSLAQIATAGLEFSEADHVYRLHGQEIPSVTSVIRDNRLGADFSRVSAEALQRARELGTAVHAALHYFDEGTLDETTVDPAVAPYLAAWQAFCADRNVVIVEMERRFADPTYQFAGTLDRIVVADVDAGQRRRVLVDVKTGGVDGAHYQTAAYAYLANEPVSTRRWAVQLHPERVVPYSIHPYASPRDWRIFRAALELTHERAAIGRHWSEPV